MGISKKKANILIRKEWRVSIENGFLKIFKSHGGDWWGGVEMRWMNGIFRL